MLGDLLLTCLELRATLRELTTLFRKLPLVLRERFLDRPSLLFSGAGLRGIRGPIGCFPLQFRDLGVQLARSCRELELPLVERAGARGKVVVGAPASCDDVRFPLCQDLRPRLELGARARQVRLGGCKLRLPIAERLLESAHLVDLLTSVAERAGLGRGFVLQVLEPRAERVVFLRELQLSRIELTRAGNR